jgi:3-oxoacyl-[acyl-carrier protein] reductase
VEGDKMLVDVSQKVVVITGSSRGIGRELARQFAREHAKVVINYFNSYENALELYNEINQFNENCILVQADITKKEEVFKLYKETINAFDQVDILINNAGICSDNLLAMMSYEQWQQVIDINLNGVFNCCKIFSKEMIKKHQGKIINISSLKGQLGSGGQVNYSASKAAVIGFTKALAKELGVFNISVNAICPGYIATDLNRENQTKKETAQNLSILGTDNNLNDLANFVLYLSSDKMLGVSGQVFNIDSRVI